jgi:hypothetical protein
MAIVENSMDLPGKIKNNPSTGYVSKATKISVSKIHLHPLHSLQHYS